MFLPWVKALQSCPLIEYHTDKFKDKEFDKNTWTLLDFLKLFDKFIKPIHLLFDNGKRGEGFGTTKYPLPKCSFLNESN